MTQSSQLSYYITTLPLPTAISLEEGMYLGPPWWLAQLVKELPAMQETYFQFLGWEDPLEKGSYYFKGLQNSNK